MPTTSRAQFDADRFDDRRVYTEYPTPTNQHRLNCGSCNQPLYVDSQTFDRTARAIAAGLDNPFLCDGCRDEYGELEHSPGH
jgi:hypothetical protein